ADVAGQLFDILLATPEPHDFSFVEQSNLPQTRGAASENDLQGAVAEALFPNAAKTRGSRIRKKKQTPPVWLTRVIEWEVLPADLATKTLQSSVAMKTRGSATPVATANPTTSKSLTTSSTDEGYELVKVFFGTDREALIAGTDATQSRPPLIPLVCGLVTAIAGFFVWKSRSPLRITIVSLAVIATGITTAQHLLASMNQAIAQERTGVQYGPGRGEFEVGTCEISIPKDHRVGLIESPSIFSLEFREDPSKHVIIDSITRTPFDEYYQDLSSVIEESPRKEAMVFVHGYNVSFDDAARRTGQMAYDLKYTGAPIFFSWPSQATEIGYTVDENNVTWAVPHLKQFLEDIRKKTGVQSLNIIAHSMGNRAVTNVLKELYLEYQDEGKLFNQVILAAPDVDAAVFETDIAPKITKTAKQVTLYASSKDRALVASRNVHGYPRAGESGEDLVVVEDIHTIDVTEIDTSLLGHNYYGDSDSIVADIYHVLHREQPPSRRPKLRVSFLNQLEYWIFKNE
ncbi:MAG: alpha/beta hydrolase, partial [Planctomycetota bacterium]